MKLTWTQADVGCYWTADTFTISTRVVFRDGRTVYTYPDSGYVLTRNRRELGTYRTLAAAQRAAQALSDGYGLCIACGHSTRRKLSALRPCCRKCERTVPVAMSAPATFTRGAAGKLARLAESEVELQGVGR